MEADLEAYSAKHLKTTEKRMAGKEPAIFKSYTEQYGN